MLRERPSFFGDWARHGLGGAWTKRFGSFELGGNVYRIEQLESLSWVDLRNLLGIAISEMREREMCWVFEQMLIRNQGNIQSPWTALMFLLQHRPEVVALPVIERLSQYAEPADALKTVDHGAYGAYLVGKVFSSQAQAAKGVNKAELQNKKVLALHFLGQARERAQHEEQSGQHAYRATIGAAGLAAAVAATYEATAYLQYKGTRTAAMVE